MLAFPMHPRYSRMLLAAHAAGCVRQSALIAALTQGRDLLIRNPGREIEMFRESLFGGPMSSDFWILMRAWEYAVKNQFRADACRRAGIHALTARQAGPLLDHFLELAADQGLDTRERTVPDEALRKCILTGFSDRVARRLEEGSLRCELVHNRRGVLARESAVQNGSLLVATEIREVEGSDGSLNTLLSLATAVEAEWLRDMFPDDMAPAPFAFITIPPSSASAPRNSGCFGIWPSPHGASSRPPRIKPHNCLPGRWHKAGWPWNIGTSRWISGFYA